MILFVDENSGILFIKSKIFIKVKEIIFFTGQICSKILRFKGTYK